MSNYEKRILRVLTYIHENPSGDLSLDQLAEVAAMSRFHWHRVFMAMTGETCAEAVRRVRMYRAGSWLSRNQWPVSEVAKKVGYSNTRSFSRAFRQEFDITPAAFRAAGEIGPPPRQIPKGDFKMFPISIRKTEPKRLAALLHIGAYTEIGPCFDRLSKLATQHDLWVKSSGMIGVHHDDPNVVAEIDLTAHAGLTVPVTLSLPDEFDDVRLEGGEYAVLTYKGPYTTIKVAYDYLFGKWLAETGREPADAPCYEVYHNSPSDTDEKDLLTDILLPLKSE